MLGSLEELTLVAILRICFLECGLGVVMENSLMLKSTFTKVANVTSSTLKKMFLWMTYLVKITAHGPILKLTNS
jgi:hypothetical protein